MSPSPTPWTSSPRPAGSRSDPCRCPSQCVSSTSSFPWLRVLLASLPLLTFPLSSALTQQLRPQRHGRVTANSQSVVLFPHSAPFPMCGCIYVCALIRLHHLIEHTHRASLISRSEGMNHWILQYSRASLLQRTCMKLDQDPEEEEHKGVVLHTNRTELRKRK